MTALTLAQAEDLAARTLAAIDRMERLYPQDFDHRKADYCRERVASDLDGLREHHYDDGWCAGCDSPIDPDGTGCNDLQRYSAGLLRTAALYGCAP